MTPFQIDLDYGLPAQKPDGPPQMTPSELTLHYVESAVTEINPEGLEGQRRRVFGRLQRKIVAAIDAGEPTVELEEAEKDLVRKAFEKAKFQVNLARYVIVLEDEIDSWRDRERATTNGKAELPEEVATA